MAFGISAGMPSFRPYGYQSNHPTTVTPDNAVAQRVARPPGKPYAYLAKGYPTIYSATPISPPGYTPDRDNPGGWLVNGSSFPHHGG